MASPGVRPSRRHLALRGRAANSQPAFCRIENAIPTTVDLFFTSPSTVYLTIQNIGNVASSASQNEIQVKIKGQEKTFVITQPISPGGTRRNPLPFDGSLGRCDQILVELDTNPNLKFQVLQGAFPNDDVFANDRKTMPARYIGSAAPPSTEAACPDGRFDR